MLRNDKVVNRQIETPLRGCVIGVTVHKVLDQASGLANAPLPCNHRAIGTEWTLIHQVSAKWTMGLPDHLPTQFKKL
jgi:hypothetical protein